MPNTIKLITAAPVIMDPVHADVQLKLSIDRSPFRFGRKKSHLSHMAVSSLLERRT
jgi:hypothetical protein